MKKVQKDAQTTGVKLPSQILQEPQLDQHNNQTAVTPSADSASISNSGNQNRKVSPEDIELVQNLIERCLQLYMNQGEVVRTLLNRARIEPGFTTLVWQKLEEENPDFFRAYYIRLKLKKQIILFNRLLEHQYHLMKYPTQPVIPVAPVQNGIHQMSVNHLPMGYPVLQHPAMPAHGQHHLDSMNRGLSSCHVVNGLPAPGNFHHIRKPANGSAMGSNATEAAPPLQLCSAISAGSEMAASPVSVASSGHFPFTPSEISGMDMDTSAMDATFTSEVGAGSSKDTLLSMGQIPWDFSELSVDLNLEDLELGNYTGSAFLPSDSELLLESPEHDDLVNEYFADNIAGPCPPSDEEKP